MAREDIIIKMGMDASAFNRGLQQAKIQGKEFNAQMNKFAGAVGALGLAALTAKTVEYGSKIADLSARLGVSTDALQEFAHAAQLSGGSLEDVAAALQKLAVSSQDALDGGEAGEKMAAAFAKFGVTAEDLKTLRIEDLFRKIGAGVRDAADVQTVLNDAVTILGKNSANVLAAMRNDLDAAAEEAKRLGLILGDDVIKKLDELGDSADTLGKRLMSDLAGPLTWVADRIFEIIAFSKIAMITIAGIGTMLVDRVTGGKEKAAATLKAMAAEVDNIIGQEAARTQERKKKAPPITQKEAADNAGAILNLQKKKNELEMQGLDLLKQKSRLEKELELLILNRLAKGKAGEKEQLEHDIKKLELQKKLKDIDEKRADIKARLEQKARDLEGKRAEAETMRGDRTKFTLGELAGANLRGIADPKLRADILKAREVQRLESEAGRLLNRGDRAGAEAVFSKADTLRSGIESLKSTERLTDIFKATTTVADEIKKFNAAAEGTGIKVKPVFG